MPTSGKGFREHWKVVCFFMPLLSSASHMMYHTLLVLKGVSCFLLVRKYCIITITKKNDAKPVNLGLAFGSRTSILLQGRSVCTHCDMRHI